MSAMRSATRLALTRSTAGLPILVGAACAVLLLPSPARAAVCTNTAIHVDNVTLVGPSGVRTVTDMTGNVREADQVSVRFTIAPACTSGVQVSLVSYKAPNANFGTQANLNGQQIYHYSTGPVTPGEYEATIRVPNCYFQIDFVRGAPITQFSSTVTYTRQGRLIDAAVGGTQACGPADISLGEGPPPQPAPTP
jgi:hypothetical protein